MKLKSFSLFLLFCFALLLGCSKDDTGTLKISNNSTNTYELFINGASKGEFSNREWRNFYLDAGSYTLKAEQVTGSVLFPTVKNGQVTISSGEFLEWSFP
jgi:hypothetical protein